MEQWERLLEQLHAEFLLREEELELLHEIDLQLLKSERPLNTMFEFIVRRTQDLLKSDHTSILLRRGRFLQSTYSTNETNLGQRIDIATSLTGGSLTSATTINIGDITVPPNSNRYVPIHGYVGPPIRSLLATPIKVHGTMVGVLNAESTHANAFKPVLERVITAIAAQVAIAFQRMQLFDRNRLFSEVDQLIFTGDSQQVISLALQKVMDALQELEHIQLSGAQIVFRTGDELQIVHSTNPSDVGLALRMDESIIGRAVRERTTVIVGDVSKEPQYRRMLGSSIQSEIAIPIMLGDSNIVIGALNVESEELDAFEGFYQIVLDNFADRVRTLLAFAKLRSDVTEAIELRNANDLLVAVGDQASHMIHRMNNTVGAMRVRIMELEDLQQTGELSSDAFLTESLAALERLADQTLQMPEEVTRLLNRQGTTVNVNEVVRAVLEKFDMPGGVTLDLRLAADSPSISLYSFDIVVQNLLQNAIEAMPQVGTLSVSTSYVIHPDLPTGYIELSVKDSGTGIPEEILPKIFDLNFSTKHGKGKGHGLGLWWIRNFVLRARGDITVTSSVGEGSEFIVKIPFERRAADGGAH